MAKIGRLAGHVAVVTGASSGIGAGVARAFAGEGAAVALNYHSHGEAAEALAGEIERDGGRALAVGADVSDEAEVANLFNRTAEAFGRVDILVANSGLQKDAAFTEMTLADDRFGEARELGPERRHAVRHVTVIMKMVTPSVSGSCRRRRSWSGRRRRS